MRMAKGKKNNSKYANDFTFVKSITSAYANVSFVVSVLYQSDPAGRSTSNIFHFSIKNLRKIVSNIGP